MVSSARDSPGARAASSRWQPWLKPPGLDCAPRPRGALFAGEARSRLRWADGKTIKNEVDLQVGVRVGVRHCLGWCPLSVPCLLWDLLACPAGLVLGTACLQ